MGTVIIGGGPRPGAKIYAMSSNAANPDSVERYAIFDGNECLGVFETLDHAEVTLPLIQSGE